MSIGTDSSVTGAENVRIFTGERVVPRGRVLHRDPPEDGAGIGPGLCADLLPADGDPTTEITATRSIAGVWRGGVRAETSKGEISHV